MRELKWNRAGREYGLCAKWRGLVCLQRLFHLNHKAQDTVGRKSEEIDELVPYLFASAVESVHGPPTYVLYDGLLGLVPC